MLENIKLKDLILGKKLGNGAFGEVFISKISGKDAVYATKRLEKSRYKRNPKAYRYLENEINILSKMNHKNIIRLYNSDLETPKYKYLITEYCNGGDLNGILEYYKDEKKRPFTEEEIQYIMRQIISGIKYLHIDNKIIHRDLKLENIMLHYENEEDRLQKNILKAKIKIIDFGFARYNEGTSIIGSPMYMDPRILMKLIRVDNIKDFSYEQKADIYSLGVICYYLLTGNPLFDVQSMEDLAKATKKGEFEISSDLSKEAILFLNNMLRYDPKKRLNIKQLSEHAFITNNVKTFQKVDDSGNQLIFDMNTSCIMFKDKKTGEKEIIDDSKSVIIIDIKENSKENKKVDVQKVPSNIEKLIWDSFKIINKDGLSIEPKLVSFIPGVSPDIVLEKH